MRPAWVGLLCLVLMLTYTASGQDHCSTFEQLNPKSKYLPEIKGEQIARWLLPEVSGKSLDLGVEPEFGVIEWPQEKNLWVAFLKRSRKIEYSKVIQEVYVGILERSNENPNKFKVRARLASPLQLREALSASVIGPDFANYRLNEEEASFGVRICYAWGGLRYSASNKEEIHLFRMNKNDLAPILTTSTRSYQWSQTDYTQPVDEAEFVAFLKVETSKTLGFYDWTKRSKGKSPQRFRWNGTEYISSDPENLTDAGAFIEEKQTKRYSEMNKWQKGENKRWEKRGKSGVPNRWVGVYEVQETKRAVPGDLKTTLIIKNDQIIVEDWRSKECLYRLVLKEPKYIGDEIRFIGGGIRTQGCGGDLDNDEEALTETYVCIEGNSQDTVLKNCNPKNPHRANERNQFDLMWGDIPIHERHFRKTN